MDKDNGAWVVETRSGEHLQQIQIRDRTLDSSSRRKESSCRFVKRRRRKVHSARNSSSSTSKLGSDTYCSSKKSSSGASTYSGGLTNDAQILSRSARISAAILVCGVRVRSRMTISKMVLCLPGAAWNSLRFTCIHLPLASFMCSCQDNHTMLLVHVPRTLLQQSTSSSIWSALDQSVKYREYSC